MLLAVLHACGASETSTNAILVFEGMSHHGITDLCNVWYVAKSLITATQLHSDSHHVEPLLRKNVNCDNIASTKDNILADSNEVAVT